MRNNDALLSGKRHGECDYITSSCQVLLVHVPREGGGVGRFGGYRRPILAQIPLTWTGSNPTCTRPDIPFYTTAYISIRHIVEVK